MPRWMSADSTSGVNEAGLLRRSIALAVALWVGTAAGAAAAPEYRTIHVGPPSQASDGNPGTQKCPVRTGARAVDLIRDKPRWTITVSGDTGTLVYPTEPWSGGLHVALPFGGGPPFDLAPGRGDRSEPPTPGCEKDAGVPVS